ncbi:MAG: 6-bladed beta-propeller [Candidatus Latescibacteria bacterium]|nr:6-bladed beta-propeller [Candidatus Latescibacterota bacterium]
MRIKRHIYLTVFLLAFFTVVNGANAKAESSVWDFFQLIYKTIHLSESDESRIPVMPVEFDGELGLELQRRVRIPFSKDTPGIGEVGSIRISPEETLLLTDRIGARAHEFSLTDGHYIRSFGRNGTGPGEYRSVDYIAMDTSRNIYLMDQVGAKVLRYDRIGGFIDKTRLVQGCRILTGRNGELYFVRVNRSKIVELERRDSATWAVMERTPLSTERQGFISFRMGNLVRVCYNASSHRLYYLGPNDYMVKEIDGESIDVIKSFGLKPDGFRRLPKRYHGIGNGTRQDLRNALSEISHLRNMTLVQGRYLLISYKIALPIEVSWVVYDLDAEDTIKAYALNQDAKKITTSFGYNVIPITNNGDRIYMWRGPSENTTEEYNGTLEIYKLRIGKP